MGRYPFVTASKAYLAFVRPYVAPATWTERERKLRYLAHVFGDLRAQGLVETTNLVRFDEREIGAFVGWMKERDLGLEYQVKLLQCLGGLLAYVGNTILERMKARKFVQLPHRVDQPIYVKDDAWFEVAMRSLEAVRGWRGEAARFALAFYYHTGLRVKELRLARFADVDTSRWTLAIEHPKGEGVWASAGERVAIFPSLRSFVMDFLDARSRRCRKLGLSPEAVEPLIPTRFGQYYSEPGWRMLRLKAFRAAGIEETSFRIMRPSFAQRLKDRGASIEAVSRALRHSSTATTERFYARIRTSEAWNELGRLWEAPVVVSAVQLVQKTA